MLSQHAVYCAESASLCLTCGIWLLFKANEHAKRYMLSSYANLEGVVVSLKPMSMRRDICCPVMRTWKVWSFSLYFAASRHGDLMYDILR